jgi:hypothetical protein
MNDKPADRFELLTLLSEACELEHGLACSYLYAAFSLKQELSEGGVDWKQLQQVRLWAAQIFHVAAEEMLHLAQAWNLLSAIGGSPWYDRPNFPQPSDYYPLHLPLETRPFSLTTLDAFIKFELPTDDAEPAPPLEIGDPARNYLSVGRLYRTIAEGIDAAAESELFIGNAANQVGPELMDFPDLVKVHNRATARAAIAQIIKQGEGCSPAAKDSHYAIFRRVRHSFLEASLAAEASGVPFEPVRPCIENPVAFPQADLAAPGANPIRDPTTARAADLFDSVYVLMLRLLQYVFDGGTDDPATLKTFSRAALRIMTTVIKPFGEALALMPAGSAAYGGATAGAPFTVRRNVALPLDPQVARRIAAEKLGQLNERLAQLIREADTPPQLAHAAERLAQIKV